jgi:NADH dehydrogenase
MILVAGATGVLGAEIVRQLRDQNRPVRALVRKTSDPAKVARLKNLGATIVEGDLTEPASLELSCQGSETVITTVTAISSQNPGDTIATVDQAGQINLVDAAIRAGVSKYIYISVSGNLDVDCPFITAKRTVERRVMNSDINYTILRPSCFMEFWLSPIGGFNYPNHRVTVYGEGKNPLSWISMVDVAHFAVMAVDSLAARNTILELGGPDKLSPRDAVRIFEKGTGRPFQVEYVPEEALRVQREMATDPLQQSFSALLLAIANGDAIDMEEMLQRFPLTLTSVHDYAERVMAIAA